MRYSFLLLALLLGVFSGRASDVVPVEKFALGTNFSRARLSPDGRYIACFQEVDGDQWLVILDLETKKNVRVNPGHTQNQGLRREISSLKWISNRRVSYLTTTADGLYFTGVSAVDCDGKNWVAFSGSDASPRDEHPLRARQIIYSFGDKAQSVLMIDRGEGEGKDLVYPDVIRVSTMDRSVKIIVKNPGTVVGWVADRDGTVRLGITREGLRFGAIYRENEQTAWRTMPLFAEARGQVSPLGFSHDGNQLIVAADNEQHRRAVYYYDLASGTLGEVIASHAEYDIIPQKGGSAIDGIGLCGPVFSDESGISGIRYITDGPTTQWFEPRFESMQAGIDKYLPHTVNLIFSRSKDETRFLVLAFSDRDPGAYYLIDRKSGKPVVSKLSERITGFPVASMVSMHPIKYRARDGEEIRGYLTLPSGEKRTGLPLIVMPHGGPTVRDIWVCNPQVQFLANRGYAVLQMNYRGSPGYGTEFYLKGKREIGRGMQNDIEDGTRWAIAQGLADPDRIAIVGASYGGYSVLFALAHDPELYRCGISMAGVTDWADIIKERKGEEYKYAYAYWKEWIGDPSIDAEFLANISPVNFAGKITVPLFIVQGKEDNTVPPKQAYKMVDALAKTGHPPQVLYIAGEGHGFRQEKNRAKLYSEIENFLAKNLGPRPVAP